MHKSIWIATALLTLLVIGAHADDCLSLEPYEAYAYSSDDIGGSSYLGVDTRNVTSDRLGTLRLNKEDGVEITMVDQDAPAGKAGLKEHDVILTLNGTDVESVEQLRRMIRETPPGRTVSLGISRNGQPLTIKVQLADRKKAFAYSSDGKGFSFSMPAMPSVPAMPALPAMPEIDVPVSVVVVHSSMRSGLMVENLSSQLGDYFGVKDGHGILVRSVEKGSRAEQAGFHAGDVIIKVNGEPIVDSSDFSHALRGRKGNKISVGVIRDKKEQTLSLTLPEHTESNVFEESFDMPDIDAETHVDLSELRSEMANLKPQMELAMREAERAARDTLSKQQSEFRKQQQEEMRKQLLDIRKQMLEHGNEMNQQIRRELRGLSEI
jgi:membrane-associated protease RseP (regulator of RpoE activity)